MTKAVSPRVLLILAVSIVLAGGSLSLKPAIAAEADQRTITINAYDYRGDELRMWVVIKDITNDVSTQENVFTGFTPVSFAALPADQYKIDVFNFGTYYFDHWSDQNGMADTTGQGGIVYAVDLANPGVPFRYVPADGNNYDLEAAYRTTETPEGTTPLHINAEDQDGNALPGMYAVIYQCTTGDDPNGVTRMGCSIDQTGWTPMAFGMSLDRDYYVSAVSWFTTDKSYQFDHWKNDANPVLSAGTAPTTLTAVYKVS